MWQKPYAPIIKKRGFCPNPVAGNIPIWADGKNNPKCIETQRYHEFWEEQFHRCVNGYDTAGIHIPGRYYFFLNFVVLKGLKGPMYPFYVDLDLEYYQLLEFVKERQKMGIVAPKARRKGLSELGQTVLSHGLRFIRGYRGAITAGLETYTIGLRKKFNNTQSSIVDELRMNVLEDNEKSYTIGYERKDPIGGYVKEGFGGLLSFETMFDDPTKLEGEYFHDVICEESGQYKKLGEVIESIKPALQFGSQTIGTFLIYGTGGNILSTCEHFKDLWDNAETYNLEKFWVPGDRKYYPFFGNNISEYEMDPDTGEKIDAIPNLRYLKPWQRIGCEDIKAAEEYILKKRVEYSKLPNKKRLKKHNQSYPLTVDEAFSSGGSNNFDDEKIYARLFDVEGNDTLYKKMVLEWVMERNDDGVMERTLNVKARPATKNDPKWKHVLVYQQPRTDIKDLDVGGVDSYNQDKSQTSKSLGGMLVMRRGNAINLVGQEIHDAEYPVCIYYDRPPRKEIFYDTCLKISVWYNMIRNTMLSAEYDNIIDHYSKHGGKKYMSPRPKAFDSPKTTQQHKFGAKMNSFSKELALGIAQSWVYDYVQYTVFPALLRDLLAYDEEYIGTDWDIVDALMLAKMRIEDMKTKPRNNYEEDSYDDEPEWVKDVDGNMILVEKKSVETIKKNFKEGAQGWRQY